MCQVKGPAARSHQGRDGGWHAGLKRYERYPCQLNDCSGPGCLVDWPGAGYIYGCIHDI